MRVSTPITGAELDHTRALMKAFLAWHRARHLEDLHLIDRYSTQPRSTRNSPHFPESMRLRVGRCCWRLEGVSQWGASPFAEWMIAPAK